ncbi:hypothetical protein [Tenacibaculum sp. 47A_GOM-205m]|uniref:hypothetical protein n=1 Tax=Tenacibaculum sp. 47A_GOM-205m TaxID=1380384 RepID=UPI0004B25BC8|nr:hypothetical protein [Tenacibaculum sp. 47A_GOM-205m]
MYKNIKHINLFILTFALVLLSFSANAQEVRVVDNKGTIQTVNNNTVTTSTTAPTLPLENDVWFDTTNNQIKIYDTVDGWKLITSTLASQNIYTANGDLIDNRTLSGVSNFGLTFENLTYFQLFSNNSIEINGTLSTQLRSTGGTMQISSGTSSQISAGTTMELSAPSNIMLQSPTEFNNTLLDINNSAGTSGQVLTSTGTGVQWANSQQNTVTVSTDTDTIQNEPNGTFPVSPIENDTFIYKPTNGEKVYYVFDGTEWNMIAPTKAARVFYPPSILVPASTAGPQANIDLYAMYSSQFSSPIASSDATASIPLYQRDELYYFVTDADSSVFDISSINVSSTGILSYSVLMPPTDDNAIINVVFVVK